MEALIIFLSLIGLVCSEGGMTQNERIAILNYHNTQRGQVRPSASNMLEMEYDMALENLAQKWVSKCDYRHPNDKDPEWRDYKDLGQNLGITFGFPERNLVRMAGWWLDERDDYFYKNRSCRLFAECLHYTQLAWADSYKLGCAIARCDEKFPNRPKPVYFGACQYHPIGNYPDRPMYKEGKPCTQCPPNTKCVKNLCSRGEPLLPPLPTEPTKPTAAPTAPPKPIDVNERIEIMKFMKKVRSSTNPPAANMKEMTYSKDLEQLAFKWVRKCQMKFPSWRDLQYAGYKQSLAGIKVKPFALLDMIKYWHSQFKAYDYDKNYCNPKISWVECRDYFNMIWWNATEFGCAEYLCPDIKDCMGRPHKLAMCIYGPAYVDGQRPYEKGEPGSKCPAGYQKNGNVCSKKMDLSFLL